MVDSRVYPQIFAAVSGTFLCNCIRRIKGFETRHFYNPRAASLIVIGIGFHFGWVSPTLAKLLAEDSDIPVTSDQGSWIVSFAQIGSVCGAILAIPLVDKVGRKTSLLLMAAPQFVGCLLIAFATSYWWFYVARFITGIAIGTVLTVIPMYIGEIAEDRVRGGLGILITVMTNMGQLIPYCIGPWVSRAALAAVGAVIPIVYVATFVWAPESPYYYAMKNAPHKIEKSLTWLRGKSDVSDEILAIQMNVKLNHNNKKTIPNLFLVKANVKALGITTFLVNCQQFSGYPAISAYYTVIFNEVDSGINSSISVIIIGLVSLGAGIMAVFVADKVGRRPMLLMSMSLCTVFILCEALYFHLRASGADVTLLSWIPLMGIIGFLISYSVGVACVPFAINSELFCCEVKALAITVGAIYLCVIGVCVTKLYQIVTDAYGIHVAFYSFGACSFASTISIFFVVPETRGRSFGEIQDMLRGSSKSVS